LLSFADACIKPQDRIRFRWMFGIAGTPPANAPRAAIKMREY
jgi:hypothetical protein